MFPDLLAVKEADRGDFFLFLHAGGHFFFKDGVQQVDKITLMLR